ncbi:thermonuclease family protein [Lentzea nigeriaca]|uniref:thermonuclease family protein n=1 Tax=Lentzea nigeriaca TaxID=1128665 RepID=UPI0019592D45|nr:thermonuclease family protein [Lentzea nigeriaca]MBM7865044.1 endonuclease YncB(thermonuclease family) [Lentzea nigeriaca]
MRRFWWGAGHHTRLTIMCLGVVTALAATGAAGFLGDAEPRDHGDAGPDTAVLRGDSFEVTVHTVSDVDLFEGVEPATGLFFNARVAGLRSIADCWLTESRSTAQTLLRGKTVRLTVKKNIDAGANRIAVDVRLPDGADYAQTIVHDGVARADLSTRDELAPVESAARQERRGLWAASCLTNETPTSSSTPSSTTTTTTTSAPTSEPSTPPPPPPPPSITTTTTPPFDEHDEWDNIWLGKICFKEGARRTSPSGEEMVCARNGRNLRWRRAD